MPRPCLIMFLSKCDQDKNFHVACLVWEVGIFCPLSPLLLHDHMSLIVKPVKFSILNILTNLAISTYIYAHFI